MGRRIWLGAVAGLAALTLTATASAHAHISPSVALAADDGLFTLAVPTEKEGATTTEIALRPPDGFDIDSFEPAAGWRRSEANGTITWTGGAVPTGEDAVFSFSAGAEKTGTYRFTVKQTYSDGTVVDWSGPESSDTPAPVVKTVSSFGGGGTSVVAWIALVLGALGLVLGAAALLQRGGRPLA
jgi:uncharacterized protein YcnI